MGSSTVILVDTHVVIWLALEPAKISKKAHTAIEEARRNGAGIAISDITLLEISTLARKGRMRLSAGLGAFLSEVEARFIVLPMTGRVCARAMELPASYPKDPADRVIGSTALVEGVALVTADENIRRSKALRTIW
jgi:PIN domain nuclease of toxin-antitoxin system